MEYEKSEIEKLIICLKDTDNVINTFPLERQKQGESIIWKFEDEGFYIEIITDEAIRTVEKITKSDTIVESIDEIRHHFLDVVFETKMNQLINIEDGFDDADEEEEEDGVKYNPYNPKLIRVDTKMFSIRQMDDLIERMLTSRRTFKGVLYGMILRENPD